MPGPNFVFGTMHVKDRRAFHYGDQIYPLIAECDAFATEFALHEIQYNVDPSFMRLPEGQRLDQLLRPKKLAKLQRVFKKLTGLSLAPFYYHLPMVISNAINDRILSNDMPLSLDEHLWQYAERFGKDMKGIETFEEQLSVLKLIPVKDQLRALIWMIENHSKHRRQLLKMTEIYATSDLRRLYKNARSGAQQFRKPLLYDRNFRMADRIDRMARETSIFCAIGAGHLGGKKGVLRLLKQKGWKMKPVTIPNPLTF